MPQLPRLLYLGYAFPPGVSGLFPEAQPAGHLVETSLVHSLRPWFEVRSVGLSWIDVEHVARDSCSPGLPHALNLLVKRPELPHRWKALARLKQAYQEWAAAGWRPEVLMVCNFTPVYNAFLRWLRTQPRCPAVVVYLADSVNLQQRLSWTVRARYRLKPLKWPDAEMIPFVDACVAVSASTEAFFQSRGYPWLWLPNGCDPARALRGDGDGSPRQGPIQFGFMGNLAAHAGLPDLVRIFLARQRSEVLHICGFGHQKAHIIDLCRKHPQLRFHDSRTPDACVQLARGWDVLVNARPIMAGNENNFPTKIFEYALSGRAILTSQVSGADRVLGPDAYYFDAAAFDQTLDQQLTSLAQTPRAELDRRGLAIQQQLLETSSWLRQGERLASFLKEVAGSRRDVAPDSAPIHQQADPAAPLLAVKS